MYKDWSFFRNFISNVQMSLIKADTEIARQYARLAKDPNVEELVYGMIKKEYERTKSQVLLITEQVLNPIDIM